jgi:uncharacterized protein
MAEHVDRLGSINRITSEAELREIIGVPAPLTCRKITNHVNHLTRRFIELAPFCDVSPRGDPAGFVRILDEQTLLLPDRPGNRLADALRNIIQNPHVALLFVIPGVTDTFRVNGRAFITDDVALLADSAVEGKPPRLGIVVHIDEAFTQCSKAFIRSQLWDPETFLDSSVIPTGGQIMASINEDIDAQTYDSERAARYARRENFY